jgi:hypothetical protein
MFVETAKRLRLSLTTIADLVACGNRTPTALSNTNYDQLLDDRLVDTDAAISESHFGADRRGCVLEFSTLFDGECCRRYGRAWIRWWGHRQRE